MYRVSAEGGGYWLLLEEDFQKLQAYYLRTEGQVMTQHIGDDGVAFYARAKRP